MPKRILIVSTNYLPQIGGVEMVVDNLARYLTNQGEQVTIITSRSGAATYGTEKQDGFAVKRLYLGIPGINWKSTLMFPVLGMKTAVSLFHLIRKFKPDIIHLHFMDNAAWYALKLAQWSKVPLIVSIHGSDSENLIRSTRHRTLFEKTLNQAAAITICSQDLLNKTVGELPNKPIHIIPNGVDYEAFQSIEPYQNNNMPYILSVARLVDEKGIDTVIQAFALLKQQTDLPLKLLIAGDGYLRPELERMTTELGMSQAVDFLGGVPKTAVPSLLAGCELFVLGSRREGFGIVLLEAMAAGKPIVATRVGGIPEIITDSENGLLVPPDDAHALATAVIGLLNNETQQTQFSQKGKELVKTKYSWQKQGEHFWQIYQQAWYTHKDQNTITASAPKSERRDT